MSEPTISGRPSASSQLQPGPESPDDTKHTPTLAEWSKEVKKAGFARPVSEYLEPSDKLTQTRQGSIYWNDNGDCLAIDEDPLKGDVPRWPEHVSRGRPQPISYASPMYKLIPGTTNHRMTLELTGDKGFRSHDKEHTADMSIRSSYVPWNNRVTQITVHLTDAARSMWEEGDMVSESFHPKARSIAREFGMTSLPLYQHAASCLLEFELTDLSPESS